MTPDGSILAGDDEALLALPQSPAVFLIAAEGGRPYLARTSLLRRRALRLLGAREGRSRSFTLRDTFSRLDYYLTGSALDAAMRLYELARQHFPDEYGHIARLRMPPYLKLLLSNEWPRTMVTTHLGGARAVSYGPFRSRAAAERFESEVLDLFQIRRCLEDLAPWSGHPGCIYGEMGKCLRPCQCAVGAEEYAREVGRFSDFLQTDGRSLLKGIMTAREQLSAEMEFEEAARQHRRLEQVEEVLQLRDELAGSVERLNAVAVARSAVPDTVDLFFLRGGDWQGSARLGFELEEGKPVSIDKKLRDAFGGAGDRKLGGKEKQERLAILARWYYSTWRDGELLTFPDFGEPPFRKLVNAIGRVMMPKATA